MQRCRRAKASRKAGFVATVSAIALMQRVPILMSLAHQGTSPQRKRSRDRRPSWSSRTTGSVSVGAPLKVGAAFGTGLTVSNSTRISLRGVFCTTRPHARNNTLDTGHELEQYRNIEAGVSA